jgi:hypothetical protein
MNSLRTVLFRRFYRPLLHQAPAFRVGPIATEQHRDFLRQEIRQAHVDAKSSSPDGALQYEAHQLTRRQATWPFEVQRRYLQQGIRQAHAAARSGTMFSVGRPREGGEITRSPEPRSSAVVPPGGNPSHYLPQ